MADGAAVMLRRVIVVALLAGWIGAAWAQASPGGLAGAQASPGGLAGAQASPGGLAGAQASPVGVWNTIDDKSGELRGAVRLFEVDGRLYGRIERVYDPKAVGKSCEKCTDDRKGKPILGLDVIRGLRPDPSGGWSGGEILDPETGDTYRVSIHLAEGGQKLVVRGSILGGLIGRSQTWIRASG